MTQIDRSSHVLTLHYLLGPSKPFSLTKSTCGSMDRAFACREGSVFDLSGAGISWGVSWLRVSFFTPSLRVPGMVCPPLWGKKTPHPDPALCGILGLSFTFYLFRLCSVCPLCASSLCVHVKLDCISECFLFMKILLSDTSELLVLSDLIFRMRA